jgi:hypothetical protein
MEEDMAIKAQEFHQELANYIEEEYSLLLHVLSL